MRRWIEWLMGRLLSALEWLWSYRLERGVNRDLATMESEGAVYCEFVQDDGSLQYVKIPLSQVEIDELRNAYAEALATGKAPADCMSGDLEEILCGWAPERYEVLKVSRPKRARRCGGGLAEAGEES